MGLFSRKNKQPHPDVMYARARRICKDINSGARPLKGYYDNPSPAEVYTERDEDGFKHALQIVNGKIVPCADVVKELMKMGQGQGSRILVPQQLGSQGSQPLPLCDLSGASMGVRDTHHDQLPPLLDLGSRLSHSGPSHRSGISRKDWADAMSPTRPLPPISEHFSQQFGPASGQPFSPRSFPGSQMGAQTFPVHSQQQQQPTPTRPFPLAQHPSNHSSMQAQPPQSLQLPPRPGKIREGERLPPGMVDPIATSSSYEFGHHGLRKHVEGMTRLDVKGGGRADDPAGNWRMLEEIQRLGGSGGGGGGSERRGKRKGGGPGSRRGEGRTHGPR